MNRKKTTYAILALSILFLLYFTLLTLSYGLFNIVFSWTFLCMGICLFAIGAWELKHNKTLLSYLPRLPRILFTIVCLVCFVFFCIVEGNLLYTGTHVSKEQGNTLIVLGAQLNGDKISRLLRYRLDAALAFHETYPNTTIIVSGGKGANESVSEASAMKNYLVAHGIKESMIIEEDQSRNTAENFAFSKKLLKNDTHVSVISNDFHMYRARYLCEESGLTCSLYPAKSDIDLAPNFYFREFFGVVKDQYLTKLH